MLRFCFYSLFLCFLNPCFSQVGINTVTPSPAAVLEIRSTSDNINFGGLLPPRVASYTERDLIGAGTTDLGMMVFVESIECLQIWNGTSWEDLHCLNKVVLTGVFQNFDLNTSWGYSSDVPFFDNGTDGFYGVTSSANGGFSNIVTLTNNFLGVNDLDDEGNNGTTGFATIQFNTINIAAATNGVDLSFDYEFFEFDNGDDAYYTVSIDGVPQTEVQLINGMADLSISGSVTVTIPAGSSTVGLSLRIRQDGAGDYAGFDNFAITPL